MKDMIHVVTDSGCDLPPHVVEEFAIEVVPLVLRFGTEVFDDGELSTEEFWERASGPHHPETSQPSVGTFEAIFERLVAQGKQVLCLTITSKHSGTFNTAHLAAKRFGEAIKVVDSLSLSLGLGLQALTAAQAAWAGRSMQDILSLLEDLQARLRLTIVLDTIENLRRGGRADGFIAIAGRMTQALDIKLIVNLIEGRLRLLGAARSFKSALKRVINLVERMAPLEHLAVVHTRQHETAERTADQLAERTHFPRERIWVRETGTVVATHAGPGVIGVLAVPIPSAG